MEEIKLSEGRRSKASRGHSNSLGDSRPWTRVSQGGRDRSRSSHRSGYTMRSAKSTVSNNIFNALDDDVQERESVDRGKRSTKKINKDNDSAPNSVNTVNDSQNAPNRNITHVHNTNNNGPKPPSITIKNSTTTKVRAILNSLQGISQHTYRLKPTENGIKVQLPDITQYNILLEHCTRNVHFFTHTPKHMRKVKFCLYGLWDMPIPDLKRELESLGIVPREIESIRIYQKRYDDQHIYKLVFLQGDHVTLKNLKQTTAVFNVIVRWDYFKSKRRPPTRCTNCQEWGHGDENCYQISKCVRCAGDHASNDCPHLPRIDPTKPDEKRTIPVALVKCANCGKNHTANFSGCAKRHHYLTIQQRIRQENQMRHQHRVAKPPYENNERSFPSFGNPNPLAQGNPWHHNTPLGETNNHEQTDLFNGQECSIIMKEMMEKLSNCRTKCQQIQVMWDISTKYVYGGHP